MVATTLIYPGQSPVLRSRAAGFLLVLSCIRGDLSTKNPRQVEFSTETEPDVMTSNTMAGIQFCILDLNSISRPITIS